MKFSTVFSSAALFAAVQAGGIYAVHSGSEVQNSHFGISTVDQFVSLGGKNALNIRINGDGTVDVITADGGPRFLYVDSDNIVKVLETSKSSGFALNDGSLTFNGKADFSVVPSSDSSDEDNWALTVGTVTDPKAIGVDVRYFDID